MQLKYLSLHGCRAITDAAVVELAEPSCQLPLVHLCLGDCKLLTDKAVHALARGRPLLTSLELDGCTSVTGEAAIALVGKCERLETLCLAGIDAIMLTHALQVASAGTSLTCLDLRFTALSYEEMRGVMDQTKRDRVNAGGMAKREFTVFGEKLPHSWW